MKQSEDTTAEVGSRALLEATVAKYELAAGFEAVNYRGLPKSAKFERQLDAARSDLRWWRDYCDGVERAFGTGIQKAEFAASNSVLPEPTRANSDGE